ncbi:MAG: hypothetical protein U0237_14695 [Thermoleophilia bacterium]
MAASPHRYPGTAVLAAALTGLACWGPALAAPARAATVVGVRVGDHPAYVRVVLDVRGTVALSDVAPAEGLADPFGSGLVAFFIRRPGIRSDVERRSRLGVTVAIVPAPDMLLMRTTASRWRFKFAGWAVLRSPTRVVVDLWKSAPPTPAATVLDDGCLRLTAVRSRPGTVDVRGRVVGQVFENQFAVLIRDRAGRVLDRRRVTARNGTAWHVRLRHGAPGQAGTVEGFDGGGTGNVECLVQTAVRLRPGA